MGGGGVLRGGRRKRRCRGRDELEGAVGASACRSIPSSFSSPLLLPRRVAAASREPSASGLGDAMSASLPACRFLLARLQRHAASVHVAVAGSSLLDQAPLVIVGASRCSHGQFVGATELRRHRGPYLSGWRRSVWNG